MSMTALGVGSKIMVAIVVPVNSINALRFELHLDSWRRIQAMHDVKTKMLSQFMRREWFELLVESLASTRYEHLLICPLGELLETQKLFFLASNSLLFIPFERKEYIHIFFRRSVKPKVVIFHKSRIDVPLLSDQGLLLSHDHLPIPSLGESLLINTSSERRSIKCFCKVMLHWDKNSIPFKNCWRPWLFKNWIWGLFHRLCIHLKYPLKCCTGKGTLGPCRQSFYWEVITRSI